MALTNELVSQFAKITKQNAQTKSESIVYGTVVEYGESKYVQLDGSNVLTPYTSTTNVAAGERVTVMIKNHTATVTGNKTSPAVRNSELTEIGDKVSDFEIIVADKVDTLQLVAVEARIKDLEADNVVINDTLIANKAQINDLEVKKLTATDAEIKYANIDFANIGKAAMEYFYAKSGLIENVIVGDQTITGNLVGVTINGDRIEGNTVIAEKLVIKGNDGLYYKLNTDGMSVEAQQTDYNSLNGTIIQAKSITATKIDVKDLVAFDATIGGFKITDSAIHSIVKTSVDNTTRGIYMDNYGQFVVGDASNYMKYYKASDGSYKLEISLIDTLQSNINNMQTKIDAVPGQITAAVGDIQIGGTNLLRETGWYTEVTPRSVGWIYTYGAFIEYPYDTLPDRDDFYENGFIHWTGEKAGDCNTPWLKVKAGEVYTLSFRHRGGGLNVFIVGLNAAETQTWGPSKSFGNASTKDCSFTFTIPSDRDVSFIYAVFRTTAGNAGVLGRIKLERGNKATAWSPHPQDNSRGVQNGSDLLITKDVVRINTPELEINVSGEDGDAHFGTDGFAVDVVSSPSVRKRYTGPTELTIGGSGVDGVNCFASLGDAFAKLSDCHIPSGVTISMSSTITSLTEDPIELKNITGAPVVVNGGGVTLNATVTLRSCKNQSVNFKNLIISKAGTSPVTIEHCDLVYLTEGCKLVGTGQTYGMLASGSGIYMHSSELHGFYHAIWLMENSNACIDNCSGSNNTYALVLRSNSRAGLAIKRPVGGISTDVTCSMSSDPGAGESTTPSTPAATTTVTLTATNTRTHDGGSWYSGTNVLTQGEKSGGVFKGCIWFDKSSFAGKTIKAAAIRLYRKAGVGKGSPVVVKIGSCKNTVPAAGYNVVAKTVYSDIIGTVDQKEELKASIPVQAVQELSDGTAAGLYIYGSADDYAQFDGFDGEHPPKLLVTYQ